MTSKGLSSRQSLNSVKWALQSRAVEHECLVVMKSSAECRLALEPAVAPLLCFWAL
jgi:hypothetical protein